jgi:hypothetical protein
MWRLAARAAATVVLVAFVVLPGGRAGAGTVERINRYDVDVTIERSGELLVHETIDYDFGATPHHGIFRDIPVRVDYPRVANHDRVYPLDVLSVKASEGAPAQFEVSDEGNDKRIKIGDPDTTITGEHTYDITYRVRGAMNGFADHDELVWNAIGTEWAVPIVSADVIVHAPADILQVNCAQGQAGSNAPCGSATFEGASANFVPAGNPLWQLGPFEGMTVSVAIPSGAVATTAPILEERFTFASAFRISTNTGWIAGLLLALLVAAVVGFVWWFGRDRRYRGSAVDAAYGDGSPARRSACRSAASTRRRSSSSPRTTCALVRSARWSTSRRTHSTSPRPSSTSQCAATSPSKRLTTGACSGGQIGS